MYTSITLTLIKSNEDKRSLNNITSVNIPFFCQLNGYCHIQVLL